MTTRRACDFEKRIVVVDGYPPYNVDHNNMRVVCDIFGAGNFASPEDIAYDLHISRDHGGIAGRTARRCGAICPLRQGRAGHAARHSCRDGDRCMPGMSDLSRDTVDDTR